MTPLCPLPFNHLFINNAGILNACCISYPQYASKDEFGGELGDRSVLKAGLKNALKSNYIQSMQDKMHTQVWPKSCLTCQANETAGIKSRRIQEIELANPSAPDLDGIQTMDLRIGNVCNLACRMCSPFSSVALVKEWSDLNAKPSKLIDESIQTYLKQDWRNWAESKEIWDELFDVSHSVREINFAGGEPFLNLAHVNYLRKLASNGQSEKIQISYNTNLTLLPKWLEELLQSFKKVKVMVSIDGVGPLAEFIRYPIVWGNFERCLSDLNGLKQRHGAKLEVAFNTTVQAYNILGLTELFEYLSHSPYDHLPKFTYANILHNPAYFNIANLPPQIKAAADQKFQLFRKKMKSPESELFFESVIKQLRVNDTPRAFQEFQTVTAFYDSKRQQNFLSVAPEWSAAYPNP